MKKRNYKIDWRSKIVDLLIVIIGITIAFKLNTWNDSIKSNQKVSEYIESFSQESTANVSKLESVISQSQASLKDIALLKQLLQEQKYDNTKIPELISAMMVLPNFDPSTTTMQNISASGEFDFLKNTSLKTSIINTYDAYTISTHLENIVTDYINTYVTPFFMKNIKLSNVSNIDIELLKSAEFENIVIGFYVLNAQLINGYKDNLTTLNSLEQELQSEISKRD